MLLYNYLKIMSITVIVKLMLFYNNIFTAEYTLKTVDNLMARAYCNVFDRDIFSCYGIKRNDRSLARIKICESEYRN